MNAIEAILFALIVFGVFLGYDLRAIRKSLTDIHQTLREIEKQLRFRNSI